ncbi:MAG TPA: hypothetical protein VMB51_16810 [Solirubrobacteraceae bacterium]|nr:hypothetical protein [Solirubrobacteraceae bacterium]
MTATIPCVGMSLDAPTQGPRGRAPLGPPRPGRRFETWLWTGPAGHLLGGGADFVRALTRYFWARARGRAVR